MKSCSFLPKAGKTYLDLLPDHFMGVLSLGLVSSFPLSAPLSHSFPHLCHILLLFFLLQLQPLVLPCVCSPWIYQLDSTRSVSAIQDRAIQGKHMDVIQHNLGFALLILFLTIPIMFISKLWEFKVLVLLVVTPRVQLIWSFIAWRSVRLFYLLFYH